MLKVKERGYLIHKFPYAFGEGKGVHERERKSVCFQSHTPFGIQMGRFLVLREYYSFCLALVT